jgi:surface polysaccharide O-acyltransferase-like enzyme
MADSLVLDGPSRNLQASAVDRTSAIGSGPEIDVAPALQPAGPRPPRIDGYDWIRLFAAINIVIFHVAPSPDGIIGRGGVPAFLMIAGSIPAMRFEIEPFASFVGRRARRIFVPWLFWSGVYGVLAEFRYLHHGIVPAWTVHTPLVGTALHLWFLPAVFLGALIIWPLHQLVRSLNATVAFATVAALSVVLFFVHAWVSNRSLPIAPYGQWLFSAPAVVIGVALGLACREPIPSRRRMLILIAGFVTVLAAILHAATGQMGSGTSYVIAGLSLPLALLLPINSNWLLRNFTRVSLGVYASHPLVYVGLRSVINTQSASVWFTAPAVFAGALTVSLLLRKIPGGNAVV